MKKLPILNLEQFHISNTQGHFYANTFAQHLEHNHKSITTPHKHDFYLVVLFTEGVGTHEIDFISHPIKPGSIFMLKPGQTHNWEFKQPPEGYIFFHSASFYESKYTNRTLLNFPFFYSYQNSQYIQLKKKELTILTSYFKNIINCFNLSEIMKEQQLCSLIDLVYIKLSQLSVNGDLSSSIKSKTYMHKIYEFEKLIEQHYKTEKSPKAYANMMHISPKHLNRICTQTINKTTSELISDRVILEAKRLLIYSKNNFSEIAWALGYNDYAYFSRLFKDKTRITPSQFQKEQLKN